MASPAIGTSLIIRVETQNSPNAFASLASAIGDAGGSVSAVDTHTVGRTTTVRDVTINVASDAVGAAVQAAIEAIQHQVAQLNPEMTRREIVTIMSAIDRAHSELVDLDRRVDEIAAAQLADIDVDGVQMRAQRLAQLVVTGAAWHSWFDDEVTLQPQHAPSLSDDEAGRLRDARRRLGADLVYANARVPVVDDLPTASHVGELHDLLSRIKEIEDAVASGEVLPLAATTPDVLQFARQLSEQIIESMRLVESLERSWSRS